MRDGTASDPHPEPAPGARGLSRRGVLLGTAGAATAALLADASGLVAAATGGGTAASASGTPVEPRHGAGEWTEDPAQASLSQSPSVAIQGDIAAMPLEVAL